MRERLLKHVCCPADGGRLSLAASETVEDGHVMTGAVACGACGHTYPIEGGVPDLRPPAPAHLDGEDLGRLQKATIERFGYEWRHFERWGWLEAPPDVPDAELRYYGGLLEHTRAAFATKSLFAPGELAAGQLVLDAGCGNGRFSAQAAARGAETVGVDLGPGVLSAFANTRALENVHIVRGDLFRLPFAAATFDRIFSIGVLMHTGNAEAAFDALARLLRPGGIVVAHVYGRGHQGYELIDRGLRLLTTRLPLAAQVRVAGLMASAGRTLRRDGGVRRAVLRRLSPWITLLPTEIHMFDWWCAPVATHHRLDEVCGWFERNRLTVLRTRPQRGDAAAERKRRRNHGAITVLGRS